MAVSPIQCQLLLGRLSEGIRLTHCWCLDYNRTPNESPLGNQGSNNDGQHSLYACIKRIAGCKGKSGRGGGGVGDADKKRGSLD